MLAFLNDDWKWNGYLAAVFVVIGAGAITSAFWPGFYKTYKTKDTKFLPIKLFSLFLTIGVLMSIGSIAGIAKQPTWGPTYFKGWWFVYINVFVMSVNAYTVGLWWKNKRKEARGNNPASLNQSADVIEPVSNI